MKNLITQEHFFFDKNSLTEKKSLSVTKNKMEENQEIYIPGSKSITNRALVLAGMTSRPLTFYGILFAQDSYYALTALQSLGFQIQCNFKNKTVTINPPFCPNLLPNHPILFLGKAGTLARFFPAVILNWEKTFPESAPLSVILDGEEQLRTRPLNNLIVALKKLGGKFNSNSLPLPVSSSSLEGHCEIAGNISGQFLSGLLLAGCGAKKSIQISRKENLVQPDYIKITLKMIEEFNGKIKFNSDLTEFKIFPTPLLAYPSENYVIEADASTACYFICCAYLHNFNLKIKNLGKNTIQPDYQFITLLKNCGAQFVLTETETHVLKNNSKIRMNLPQKIDCSLFSDQALTLAILALLNKEPVEIFGIGHIRHHESNRIACLVKNLNQLHIDAKELPDGFIIYPCKKNLSEIKGDWETYHDHRFAMAGFLLASLCPLVRILNPQCVEKTAPQFFDLVENINFNVIYHTE